MKEALVGVVRSNLADQQSRAGIDLVASAALNAIAGLAFWLVAARTFDEAAVGVNAALITTMAAVANLASLGMKSGLIRFLPRFGPDATRLVTRTYVITGVCTLIAAPIVATVLARRVDELETLRSGRAALAFTAACVIWIVFVLQDSVLVALRRTALIPLANLVHAVSKLAVLAVLAISAPFWGIFAAWTVPVIAIVVWVNVVAFRALRQVEWHRVADPHAGLVRFALGEQSSVTLNMALFGALPIFVLAELGESASAYYALTWTIAYNLMLANSQVSTALLAAASHDDSDLRTQTIKAIRQMSSFALPGALGLIAFASIGLRLFGENYAASGTTILRLFAVAAVANIPVAVSITILRARRQVARLVAVYALRSGGIFLLCITLTRRHGLDGVGWAWVVGESILAMIVAISILRPALRESVD